MGIDGNFAGGLSQGLNPLLASIRQDRRTQAQQEYASKVQRDRQTAENEIRTKQNERQLARDVLQRNFQKKLSEATVSANIKAARVQQENFLARLKNTQGFTRDQSKTANQQKVDAAALQNKITDSRIAGSEAFATDAAKLVAGAKEKTALDRAAHEIKMLNLNMKHDDTKADASRKFQSGENKKNREASTISQALRLKAQGDMQDKDIKAKRKDLKQ